MKPLAIRCYPFCRTWMRVPRRACFLQPPNRAAVTRKPLLLSHTVLATSFARSVSTEHATRVAQTGGVVGIFPVNSGGYHGMTGYVDNIERMIKAVGVDHVGIGTDMDGISPPSFVAYDDYAEWPSVTGALLARGYSRDDVAKVAGGNFLRVFDEVIAT